MLLHNTLIHAQMMIKYGENIDQRSKPSLQWAGVRPVPLVTALLKTELEGVFCSDSVFISMLRHITAATARQVTYGMLLSGIF